MENILVISHRRSGTHLTIDTIKNNFSYSNPLVTIGDIEEKITIKGTEISDQEFQEAIHQGATIFKTHMKPDQVNNFFSNSTRAKLMRQLYQNATKIYVYRDGKDVLVSLYEYMKTYNDQIRNISFSEFIRNKYNPANWKAHVEGWKQNGEGILFVRFEDYMEDYKGMVVKIANHTNNEKPHTVKDVRVSRKNNLVDRIKKRFGPTIVRTSVSLRKGESGNYKNYFSQEDLEFFQKTTENYKDILGYS